MSTLYVALSMLFNQGSDLNDDDNLATRDYSTHSDYMFGLKWGCPICPRV